MFSFMRRKTDFFTMEDKSMDTVNRIMKKHVALFKADTQRQELIKQKVQEKAQKEQPQAKPKEPEGATVEEIDEEEAKRIEL